MLKTHLTIIIAAFALSACNTLSERSSDNTKIVDSKATTSSTVATASSSAKNSTAAKHNISKAKTIASDKDYQDLWHRIRDKMSLDKQLHQASVQKRIAWYARHQAYLDRVADRAAPYLFHIVDELEKRNMPAELALLPIVESAFNPFAYSRSHASGIWQFIPGTGRMYGLKQNWWYDGRRDIVAATDGALRYLEKLHKEFNGDWLHALASYNTGEGNVARAIRRNKKAGKPTDFWSLRLARETRGYVPSLLAVAELLSRPEKYGVSWKPVANETHFVKIDLPGQIDLATAAKLADISMDEIYTLNPGFNRWATDPDGPHYLLIPVTAKSRFLAGLQQLSKNDRVSWKRHVIQKGENLGQIARDYHTSVSALKQTNKLRSNLIREGRSLIIPSSQQPLEHYTLSLDSRRYSGLKQSGKGKAYVYTIRRGDTLWDIGRHYGVSIKQLSAWNSLNSRAILRPGKKLNLWPASLEKDTASAIPANYKKNIPDASGYTIRRGDSLWLIAKRFKVSVKNLTDWNNIRKNSVLKPGQKLIVQSKNRRLTGV